MPRQLHILAVYKAVLRTVIAGRRSIGINFILELQRVLCAVEVHVDDRAAVGLDDLGIAVDHGILVVARIVEAGGRFNRLLVTGDCDDALRIHADARGCDVGVRILDQVRSGKVIDLVAFLVHAEHALFPDDDGIVGIALRAPAGVQRGAFRQRRSEGEPALLAVQIRRMLLGVEPAVERIAVQQHFAVGTRLLGHIAGLDEFRCAVGCALFDFVKDQPDALRSRNAKDYVALDLDRGAVRIELAFRIVLDIAAAVIDEPAFKVMGRVALRRHVDGIVLILGRIIIVEEDLVRAAENVGRRIFKLALIGHVIDPVDKRVIRDCPVRSA